MEYNGSLDEVIADVLKFDSAHDIMHENVPNIGNIIYNALALAGEAGELANDMKKLWRDGITPERLAHAREEVIDVVIYLCKLIIVMDMDFTAEWNAKFQKLEKIWAEKKNCSRALDFVLVPKTEKADKEGTTNYLETFAKEQLAKETAVKIQNNPR